MTSPSGLVNVCSRHFWHSQGLERVPENAVISGYVGIFPSRHFWHKEKTPESVVAQGIEGDLGGLLLWGGIELLQQSLS